MARFLSSGLLTLPDVVQLEDIENAMRRVIDMHPNSIWSELERATPGHWDWRCAGLMIATARGDIFHGARHQVKISILEVEPQDLRYVFAIDGKRYNRRPTTERQAIAFANALLRKITPDLSQLTTDA